MRGVQMEGKEWAGNEAEWRSEGWERHSVCMRYRVQSSWWTTSQAHSTDRLDSISIFAVRSVQFPPGDFNLRVKELRSCDARALIKQRCEIRSLLLRGHTSHDTMDSLPPPSLGSSLINTRECSCMQARKHNKSHTHTSTVPFCDGLRVWRRMQTEQ